MLQGKNIYRQGGHAMTKITQTNTEHVKTLKGQWLYMQGGSMLRQGEHAMKGNCITLLMHQRE